MRVRHLQEFADTGTPITALTCYDALTAELFDAAGIDLLLVGDSAANVVFGRPTTLSATVAEMTTLGRAVASAARRALVVVDLPFGSYEVSEEQATATAIAVMKDTGADAVKLEGGTTRAGVIRRIVDAGVPVIAHVGYTPQSEHALGGHVIQGRGSAAQRVRADALAVQTAGACAVVLEMVPAQLAADLTAELTIPTIGIGAGAQTNGQILVWQDALGLTQRTPRFVRHFADLRATISQGVAAYRDAVHAGTFPAAGESYTEQS